jgi:undecaprenyl-diphosphatase
MWQGVDAQIFAGASAEIGKRVFTRSRPDQADDPCLWFQGKGHDSFPSGETSLATALVMPYVLEYGSTAPISPRCTRCSRCRCGSGRRA